MCSHSSAAISLRLCSRTRDLATVRRAVRIRVDPKLDKDGELEAEVDFNAYKAGDAQQLIDVWLPLTFALNSLNRCMGQPDVYPFVLSPAVIEKLGFIHHLIHAQRT